MQEMNNKDIELINKILLKFKNLGQVHDYVIIHDMLYLSCDVKTDSSAFNVYSDEVKYGHIVKDVKFLEEYRDGFAIIDLTYFELIKVFCFNCFELFGNCGVSIKFKHEDFFILNYGYYSYILFLKDLDIVLLGGGLYKIYEPYVIAFPYSGNNLNELFTLLDTRSRKKVYLNDILPINQQSEECYENGFNNHWYKSIYIVNDKLICIDFDSKIYYSVSIDAVMGRTEMVENSLETYRNIYYLKNIEGIYPYNGISLGELALRSWMIYRNGANYYDYYERSSYIAKLIYQIKYQFRKDKINELAHLIINELDSNDYGTFDVIIPVPSSNPNNEYQPLNEVVKVISTLLNIPFDFTYLLSKERTPVRNIDDSIMRQKILEESLYISDINRYKSKRILLVDDHIYKEDTIKTCIHKCCCADMFVLVIARNRIIEPVEF